MADQPFISPFNAADEKHVKNRKDVVKKETERDIEAVNYVMRDPRGRHFVWNLIAETNVFGTAFTGNSQTFFNCGRQDVGLKLMANLQEQVTSLFLAMWQEHFAEKEKELKQDEAIRTRKSLEEDNGNG